MQKVLMLASVASMIDQFNMMNIRLLKEMGCEVHVMCNFQQGNTCDDRRIRKLQQTLQELHVMQYPWDCPRTVWPLSNCYRAYMQLKKLIGQVHFAWIHCHSPIGGVLARLVAHNAGIPVIYTAHGFHFYKGAPFKNWLLYYPVEALLSHWTDVLITVNQEDFCFAKQHLCAKRISLISGIGIDTKRFAVPAIERSVFLKSEESLRLKNKENLYRKFRIPKDAVLLLSVGELNKGKNHQMVISALSKMKRQDVYYLVCGQGRLRSRLRQYAKGLGVADRIRMPGYQDQMVCIYQAADIFVLPSKREGMPVSLMEAMAAGLPCVVSDIRGSRELITQSFADRMRQTPAGGILFSLRHQDELLYALERLVDNVQLRQAYGRYNMEKMKAYDQAIVKRQMEHIYRDFCR